MKYDEIKQVSQKIQELNNKQMNLNNESNFSWIELIKNSRKLGFCSKYIFSVNIVVNPKNSSMYMLGVS